MFWSLINLLPPISSFHPTHKPNWNSSTMSFEFKPNYCCGGEVTQLNRNNGTVFYPKKWVRQFHTPFNCPFRFIKISYLTADKIDLTRDTFINSLHQILFRSLRVFKGAWNDMNGFRVECEIVTLWNIYLSSFN